MLCGRRLFRCLLAAFLFLLASWNLLGQRTKPPSGGNVSASRRQDGSQERANWFLRGRTVSGRPGTAQLRRALESRLNQRRRAALAAGTLTSRGADAVSPLFASFGGPLFGQTSVPPSNGVAWVQIGTGGTTTASGSSNQDYGVAAGRATTVVVDQGDPTGNTVYI